MIVYSLYFVFFFMNKTFSGFFFLPRQQFPLTNENNLVVRRTQNTTYIKFFFLKSFNLWCPLLIIALYYRIKILISFWCRRELNPRSLIQLSKTLPIKVIFYCYHVIIPKFYCLLHKILQKRMNYYPKDSRSGSN